jgi:acetyl-CoA carboxylase biotin carboxyl carrier protein
MREGHKVSLKLSELKELLELISERDITEFELEEDGVKLKVKKAVPTVSEAPVIQSPTVAPVAATPVVAAAPVAQAPTPVAKEEEVEEEAGLTWITSPMVGTFYRSPEPGAPPFVNEGDRVKTGQVLCIIEAMKLMNELEAELAGEVVKIAAENAQPVQFGDKLFAVKASS